MTSESRLQTKNDENQSNNSQKPWSLIFYGNTNGVIVTQKTVSHNRHLISPPR